jgi:DamX protein
MRCRLIEQLFSNTLFDPEKSLAVSILNLSKQSKDAITIVVEHAHALSLQIKYELCQLVDVANKTQGKINVVLFGQEQAAQDVATNKSIFKNKLSIIDAKSGQLFSLDHVKFSTENSLFTKKLWIQLALTFVVIITLIGISWFVLVNYDNFSLSQLPADNFSNVEQNTVIVDLKPIQNVHPLVADNKEYNAEENDELAKTVDIHAALLSETVTQLKESAAQTTDILQALNVTETEVMSITATQLTSMPENDSINIEQEKLNNDKILAVSNTTNDAMDVKLPLALTPNYYLNTSDGYVVQLVGFSDLALLKRFIAANQDLQYFSYQKILNNKLFIVLTTKIFEDKEQAKEIISTLPQAIIDRGVWVKDLALVKTEINNR